MKKPLSEFRINLPDEKISGSIKKIILKTLRSEESEFVNSNENLFNFFRAVYNFLMEYEQEELDLGERGIISDQVNDGMSAVRKFRFRKDDGGEGTSSKYDKERQNLLVNKKREEIFKEYFPADEFLNFFNFFLHESKRRGLAMSSIQILRTMEMKKKMMEFPLMIKLHL